MKSRHALVIPAARDLGVPVINRTTHHHHRCHCHDHMKVGNDKQGIGQRHTNARITQKQPGHPTVNKKQQKCNRKQHWDRQMNIALPERQHPVVDLECGWDCDDQGRRGEEKAKLGIHSADVHVVCPDDKT